jgi:hypothetical protein
MLCEGLLDGGGLFVPESLKLTVNAVKQGHRVTPLSFDLL